MTNGMSSAVIILVDIALHNHILPKGIIVCLENIINVQEDFVFQSDRAVIL